MMNGARKPLSSSMALFVVVAALLMAAHVEATDWVLFALFPALVIMLFYEPALAKLTFGSRFGVISDWCRTRSIWCIRCSSQ
jgi:hypothetical protein